MRNTVRNTFNEGLVTDLHESTAKPSTLVDANNIQYTTNSDKQLVLQKIDGVKEVVNGFPQDLTPLAVKEYNDVIYMLNYNEVSGLSEIGTFPSVDYTKSTGRDVNTDLISAETNLGVTWHASLPSSISVSNDNSASFTLTNTMPVRIGVHFKVHNCYILGNSSPYLEPGQSINVGVATNILLVNTGSIVIEFNSIPELQLNELIDSYTIPVQIIGSGSPQDPLKDTIVVTPETITGYGSAEIVITNNSGRPVEVDVQGEPGIIYWPNVDPRDFVVQDGESDNRLIVQLEVAATKHLYLVFTDSYGNTTDKLITLNPS